MFDKYSEANEAVDAAKLPELPAKKLTMDVATAKLKLALNQAGLQKLQTKIDSLVFNEDNVAEIGETLKAFRSMDKILDKAFKEMKAPYKEGADICDSARRSVEVVLSDLTTNVQTKYTSLCQRIEAEKRKAEQERLRKEAIKNGIENNMLQFSQRIAGASTLKDITAIESLINLEKARKEKYAEFYSEAVVRYDTLTGAIKVQKEKIRGLVALEEQRLAAEAAKDDEKLIEIMEKQEVKKQEIEELKEAVQLDAIENVTSSSSSFVVPEVILPTAKARYTSWKWEVLNVEKYQKLLPAYLLAVPNEEVIEAELKKLKASKVLDGKEEHFFTGVRFFLEKRY